MHGAGASDVMMCFGGRKIHCEGFPHSFHILSDVPRAMPVGWFPESWGISAEGLGSTHECAADCLVRHTQSADDHSNVAVTSRSALCIVPGEESDLHTTRNARNT